jgi:alpha-L-fucosidase 2
MDRSPALGNGTLGGMVFGGISRERIQLNESTVWTGGPNTYAHPGAVKYLDDIRSLLQEMRVFEREGAWEKARELQKQAEDLAMDKFMSIPLTLPEYQPMADLYLDFPEHTVVENYRRELDLSTGLSKVGYEFQGVKHVRESFASFPDQCIVSRIAADQPGHVSFDISLSSPHSDYEIKKVSSNEMVLRGKVENGVIEFELHLELISEGGKITIRGNALEVRGANSATLKLVAASNYTDYKTVDSNPELLCNEKLLKSAGKSYKEMFQTHLDDYQNLFNRASLHLYSPNPSTLSTDERIRRFAQENDNSIVTLLFNYGRYLAISGSREGGQTLNLQGSGMIK